MSADTFIDTNVLAYAFDQESPEKREVAQSLIRQCEFVISAQVLGELYVTLTRKLRRQVPAEVAKQVIVELQAMTVVPTTATLVARAISTSIEFQLSYWDALIIEAAVLSGCATLLTEDLNDGETVRGVRIVNPFRRAAR